MYIVYSTITCLLLSEIGESVDLLSINVPMSRDLLFAGFTSNWFYDYSFPVEYS